MIVWFDSFGFQINEEKKKKNETRIFARIPSSWVSTSICALSVSISNKTSPTWTLSPKNV